MAIKKKKSFVRTKTHWNWFYRRRLRSILSSHRPFGYIQKTEQSLDRAHPKRLMRANKFFVVLLTQDRELPKYY